MVSQLLFGALFACVVAAGSYALRFLALSGAIATLLLGVIVFGIGGWQWAIPIVTFFLLSSLLSKHGRSRKERFDAVFGKSYHTRLESGCCERGSRGSVGSSLSVVSRI